MKWFLIGLILCTQAFNGMAMAEDLPPRKFGGPAIEGLGEDPNAAIQADGAGITADQSGMTVNGNNTRTLRNLNDLEDIDAKVHGKEIVRKSPNAKAVVSGTRPDQHSKTSPPQTAAQILKGAQQQTGSRGTR